MAHGFIETHKPLHHDKVVVTHGEDLKLHSDNYILIQRQLFCFTLKVFAI